MNQIIWIIFKKSIHKSSKRKYIRFLNKIFTISLKFIFHVRKKRFEIEINFRKNSILFTFFEKFLFLELNFYFKKYCLPFIHFASLRFFLSIEYGKWNSRVKFELINNWISRISETFFTWTVNSVSISIILYFSASLLLPWSHFRVIG